MMSARKNELPVDSTDFQSVAVVPVGAVDVAVAAVATADLNSSPHLQCVVGILICLQNPQVVKIAEFAVAVFVAAAVGVIDNRAAVNEATAAAAAPGVPS